jgi:ribosomal protein S12 methylthiotransferase
VILDQPVADHPDAWIGRSFADAPEVDQLVYVTGSGLAAGQIVPCQVVTCRDYDLIAVAVGPPRS